jgi:hypothetical protein
MSIMAVLGGCVASDGAEQATEATAQEIITGCDPELPPCACALADHPMCQDPDQDGVLTFIDNCPTLGNPGQADCDGDDRGDVCDDANLIVHPEGSPFLFHEQLSEVPVCAASMLLNGKRYRRMRIRETVQFFHREETCGPGGGDVVTVQRDEIREFTCFVLIEPVTSCAVDTLAPPSPICPDHVL